MLHRQFNTKRLWAMLIGCVSLFTLFSPQSAHSDSATPTPTSTAAARPLAAPPADFAYALGVRDFSFPRDYGPHPQYQLEWWYSTGNLSDVHDSDHRFGYELTFFRRANTPTSLAENDAEQLYLADFAVTDVAAGKFYTSQISNQAVSGQAGATIDPLFRVWIQNWSMSAVDDQSKTMHLQAAQNPIAIDLTTIQTKGPMLNGDHGLSQKSPKPENASYYYSISRLATQGTLTINGKTYHVSGNSWMDHEFGTSALGDDDVGWDWFGLQLNNNREIMLYLIRKIDGSIEPASQGTLMNADDTYQTVPLSAISVDVTEYWWSPHHNARYPAAWQLRIQAHSGPIVLNVAPLVADQELESIIPYWEGACRLTGTDNGQAILGYGYVELTGYAGMMPR
ncbi:MAG TPA: lipocalin-like domain-containing protein [Aggregatilineales bacterium]|nr:lipocalin-like domain-containing protein [Aggregatilineales bacterium]